MRLLIVALIGFALSGCAAIHTSIAKRDLTVQTQVSDSIFLDPVAPALRKIYLDIRNTTDRPDFDIKHPVAQALLSRGYQLTEDPDAAHYWLRANVLNVSKADPSAAEAALRAGYGGSLGGAAFGAVIGGAADGWRGAGFGAAAGGLAGALVETVANAAVKDVTFVVVTDIEIAEKAKSGVTVQQDSLQLAEQGLGGVRRQTSSEVSEFKKYRARVVSTANQVNLEFHEAAPELTAGLARSISGFF